MLQQAKMWPILSVPPNTEPFPLLSLSVNIHHVWQNIVCYTMFSYTVIEICQPLTAAMGPCRMAVDGHNGVQRVIHGTKGHQNTFLQALINICRCGSVILRVLVVLFINYCVTFVPFSYPVTDQQKM